GLLQGRASLEGPLGDGWSLRAQVSRLHVDGFRPHSSARRTLGNVRLGWEQGADRVLLVLNSLSQPAQDPLGLNQAQFDVDPDQTTGVALPQNMPGEADRFNTRKHTAQDQAGLSWRHRFGGGQALSESQVALYSGRRSVTQWQSIPVATQSNATNPALTERHPGGVIDFDRRYRGVDARLVWRWALAGERGLQLVAGAAVEDSNEDRRGFENFSGEPATRLLGVTGRLRRDEVNQVRGRDLYAQMEAELTAQWALTFGLRHSRVDFSSDDRFIAGSNGDDSGSLGFAATKPVAAVQWRASPAFTAYLSLGKGSETPTLNELAYRPDGAAGLNTELKAQTSRQVELGAKWRDERADADVALFDARSEDEIGVASNRGGRATFRNIGRTQRRGAELSTTVRFTPTLSARQVLAAPPGDAFEVEAPEAPLATAVTR
ncbi:MAG: TonB-dependent receptor, partial [Rubrivivax sp.]|nr:TonB-dependent receptor [Rubrivivax sp.]